MNTEERRQRIIEILEGKAEYVNAGRLSQELGVSRQVIVSDVAILRERGFDILSTPRGYLFGTKSEFGYVGTVACRHRRDQVCDEFYLIVDNGGVVIDLAVEHAIYGQLSGQLNIRSRYDADLFIKRVEEEKAMLLSALTDGFHLHHVGVQCQEDFLRIEKMLRDAGILCEE